MRDRSLTRQERSKRIEEIKIKYAAPAVSSTESKGGKDSGSAEGDGGVRLSAVDAASKHHHELEFLRSRLQEVQRESKQENYDSSGTLVQQWSKVQKEEITDIDAHIDEQRRLYFKQLEDEKRLREIIARRDSLLAEQRREQEAQKNNGLSDTKATDPNSMDLSTKGNLTKKAAELEELRATVKSTGQSVKKGFYDENGVLVKQWANINGESDDAEQVAEQSIEEKRRQELLSIMTNRKMSKDEKAIRIQEVKDKYDQGGGEEEEDSIIVVQTKMPDLNNALDEKRKQEFESM